MKKEKIKMKTLVTYFSATGTTKDAAEFLANTINADIFEIQPQVPYTSADLDWRNSESRSSKEMRDKAYRPEIVGICENIDDYDTIFVGFPIWWYIAPTIINTFLESCNLNGKTVVLFATSGGSNFGKTVENLKSSCKGCNIIEGKLLNGNLNKEEILNWVKEIK